MIKVNTKENQDSVMEFLPRKNATVPFIFLTKYGVGETHDAGDYIRSLSDRDDDRVATVKVIFLFVVRTVLIENKGVSFC